MCMCIIYIVNRSTGFSEVVKIDETGSMQGLWTVLMFYNNPEIPYDEKVNCLQILVSRGYSGEIVVEGG